MDPPQMVELSDKERTALSILHGLRQKFSIESNKSPKIYTSGDLYRLFSELMTKLNRNEVEIYERVNYIEKDMKSDDPVWGVIDDAIERSKIKRYRWKSFFKKSLTHIILELKKKGLTPEQAFQEIIKHEKIKAFIEQHSAEKDKMLNNIRISVSARYGESNTEEKIMNGD
jgi:hypothetical protein